MNLVRQTPQRLVFQLGRRETFLLLHVLRLYPCVPPAHHVLSQTGRRLPDPAATQELLDEALAEQRAENKKLVQALLADQRRFAHTQRGSRLSLPTADVEWLLQVLNDIRVGNWLALGAPEDKLPELTEDNAPPFLAMEVAGGFQMQLLQALQGKK
jgi:hypothetical protein